MARSEEYIEQIIEKAITRDEIISTIKRIKVGDSFRILDMRLMKTGCESFGRVIKAKVKRGGLR